jgi:predicted small lipoprotein YifL
MKRKTLSLLTAAALVALLSLAGCGDDDGPAEEAGESVDEAVEEAGDEIEEATD